MENFSLKPLSDESLGFVALLAGRQKTLRNFWGELGCFCGLEIARRAKGLPEATVFTLPEMPVQDGAVLYNELAAACTRLDADKDRDLIQFFLAIGMAAGAQIRERCLVN